MIRSLFLVVLQTVHCHSQPKTPVKRRLLEISRKGTLPNIPCTCQIFRQSCNTQKFLLLYWKVISSQTLSQQFWSFSEQTKKKIVVESVFGIVISGWIGKLEFFKRNAIKDGVIFFYFPKFHNSDFSKVQNFRGNFFITSLYYRPFSGKLPTISQYSKKTFFLESAFKEVRNSGLQGRSIREKGRLSQIFFWNFRNFRTFFPFWALSECICSAAR